MFYSEKQASGRPKKLSDVAVYWRHPQVSVLHRNVWIFILQRLLSSSPISKMPCQEVAKMTDQQVSLPLSNLLKALAKSSFVGARLGEFFWHCYDWLWRGALGWGRTNTRQISSMPQLIWMLNMRLCWLWRALILIELDFFWQDLQMWFKGCVNLARGCSMWQTTVPSTGGSTRPKLTSLGLEGTWWDDPKETSSWAFS